MLHISWQKSSFSSDESNNCLYLAASPNGTVRLRESATPAEVITTTPTPLEHFIRALKSDGSRSS
ncbi:DUF397 domain-containing protein [Streptomyces acidicola]|uniref:DUF397 domain-containing protein n=1 Tax=Streptomyces acidicola TaxID=2596892 RepID=UPI00378E9E52